MLCVHTHMPQGLGHAFEYSGCSPWTSCPPLIAQHFRAWLSLVESPCHDWHPQERNRRLLHVVREACLCFLLMPVFTGDGEMDRKLKLFHADLQQLSAHVNIQKCVRIARYVHCHDTSIVVVVVVYTCKFRWQWEVPGRANILFWMQTGAPAGATHVLFLPRPFRSSQNIQRVSL